MLMPFALSLRLPLTVADAIALKQHLGLTHTTEFIRAVDPWCYPGDETQAAVVLQGCVQWLLSKSRDVVEIFSLFPKKVSLLSSFLRSSPRKGQRSSENPRESAALLLRQLPLRQQPASTWTSFQSATCFLPALFNSLQRLWPLRCPRLPTPPPPRRPLCPLLLPGSSLMWVHVYALSRILPRASLQCMPPVFFFATVVNTNAAVSIPSKLQEETVVRVGAGCRGNGWFPGDWMASVPYFEVMKDAAAPRRES